MNTLLNILFKVAGTRAGRVKHVESGDVYDQYQFLCWHRNILIYSPK